MQFPRPMLGLGALLLIGPALAAEPDRSSLSYEDNVTINTACYAARVKDGAAAFERCVKTQIEQLADHPAPDRTALSDRRVRAVETDCAYLRRIGVAQYNDCLSKAATAEPPPADADDKTGPASAASLARALTERDDVVPIAAVTVPLPKSVLAKRPDHYAHAAVAPAELYKKVERAVFVVGAARSLGDARARDIMQGSAIAVAPHLLLTNCHVVDHRPVIVLLQDHITYKARLIAADPAADRCVLESEGPALEAVAGVRPFDDIAVGEHVYAIGAPRGLERTMTEGLVSGKRAGKGRNMIQTSAPLSPGSSGGGLFDERGNLLGITTLASLPGSQNLNFAIAAADFWE